MSLRALLTAYAEAENTYSDSEGEGEDYENWEDSQTQFAEDVQGPLLRLVDWLDQHRSRFTPDDLVELDEILDSDNDRDERECSRCGDEVLILNSHDECMACEGTVRCSRCDADIMTDDMHAYRETEDGPWVCGSCSHDENRSG